MKPPFDLDALRSRLAAGGIHPAREPGEFQSAAEIAGLTPAGLGYGRFAIILHRLRQEATVQTGGAFALSTIHDPRTHMRLGYVVHTHQQQTADQIAANIRALIS